ncbi:hypothetical protein APH_0854 [Anaplasma phagocytophilum str. HZ]|uniref:Uncharacterized protein n=1 Tax=Anaplasma phagocytophilum (strain HZ) TaxID=212042 RepID=Q2GJM0_ANAPZ|nr:hypothetical protein APH_0854 [Anaplasma phagocytophilum str. HZ]
MHHIVVLPATNNKKSSRYTAFGSLVHLEHAIVAMQGKTPHVPCRMEYAI